MPRSPDLKGDIASGAATGQLLLQENLWGILNSITEGILVVNQDLIVTQVNKAGLEITGFSSGEILGQPCLEIFRGSLCESHCFMADSQHGQAAKDVEVEIIRRDGTTRAVAVTTSLLFDGHGLAEGVVVVFRDISEYRLLKEQLKGKWRLARIIGKSPTMQRLFQKIQRVAPMDTTVLIQGESGTGKELVAHALHHYSPRASRPLIKVNCSALAETLLESELFGHVRGSFTGAIRDKIGRFEAADGGTLLLDEIGDLSNYLQLKLLRVLQEKEFERVGEVKSRKVNVRVLAATHQDLKDLLKKGLLREDLYYRLKVVPIHLPPLRERREDILLLVKHFVAKYNMEMEKSILGPTQDAVAALMDYPWPGNIRELENAIEHAFVHAQGLYLTLTDFPSELHSSGTKGGKKEMEQIRHALKKSRGNKTAAANLLGIGRATLWRKLKNNSR
ncbi:MAG TPA: sigma 54-interacting transcriptional regulator [Nitrospirales bacterium]|nr:sigma 54-interacting transcriptional regulator [Nitrospirales bacterium]